MKLEDYEHVLRPVFLVIHRAFAMYERFCNLAYVWTAFLLYYIGLKRKPATHLASSPEYHPGVLLTGGTSGIGRSTVLKLAQNGYTVFATYRDQNAADDLMIEYSQMKNVSGEIILVELDVMIEGSLNKCYEKVNDHLKRIGVPLVALVNNAGFCTMSGVEVTSTEDYMRQFSMVCGSYIDICKAFIPLLKKSKGRIVNVNSVGSFMITPGFSSYCSAKSAMQQITYALRMELSRYGMTATSVEPGFTTAKSIYSGIVDAYDKFYKDLTATGVTSQGNVTHADKPNTYGGQDEDYIKEAVKDYRVLLSDWYQLLRLYRVIGEPTTNVSENIIHAITAPYCKPSYIVGFEARFFDWQKRYLPEDLHEWMMGFLWPFVVGETQESQRKQQQEDKKINKEILREKKDRKEPLEDHAGKTKYHGKSEKRVQETSDPKLGKLWLHDAPQVM